MNYKLLYRGIRSFYNELKVKDELNRFNNNSNNNIRSNNVALNSVIGHDITAMEGALICENSTIDSYSFVGYNTLISKTKIGRYNSIASNVNIGHGEHLISNISTNSHFVENTFDVFTSKDCIIENDVWLGVSSIIRRGVKVGTGAVVGANSFVNKDVPPFAIVIGSPARILKYRFSEDKINRILDSQWWNYDLVDAKRIIDELEISTNEF